MDSVRFARALLAARRLARRYTAGADDPRVVAAHARLQATAPDRCPPLDTIRVTHLIGDDVLRARGFVYLNTSVLDDPDKLVELLGRTRGADDDRIVAALQHLRTLEPRASPSLTDISVAPLSAGLEGTCRHGLITINSCGEIYRDNDPRRLALLLHHEHFHAMHPDASELDARRASARFARAYGDDALAAEIMSRYVRPLPRDQRPLNRNGTGLALGKSFKPIEE